MREIWFVAVVGLLLAGAYPAAAQAPKPGTVGNSDKVLAVTKEDRILGQPDAPITIVEYASLTCPHCAHFAGDVLPQLKKKWIDTGKAKLVMRDFPRDREDLRAQMLARCVAPERYYPLVEMLFQTQESWVLAQDWQAALERTVRLAGIGKEQFDSCLADKKLEDQVIQSGFAAQHELSVNSTPTFFVNGKKFEGAPTVEAFDQLLSGAAGK